jgi:hypothetical protein
LAYQGSVHRNPRNDETILRFIEVMAIRFTNTSANGWYELPGGLTTEEAIQLADATLATGCTDPLVLYAVVAVLPVERVIESGTLLTRILPQILDGDYQPRTKYFVSRRYLKLQGPSVQPALRDRATAAMTSAFCLYLAEPITNPLELRLRYEEFVERWEQLKPDEKTKLLKAIEETPAIDPWLLNVIRGIAETDLAWVSRGSGWANTVTAEGWKGFREHLTKARDALVAAHKLRPDFPEAATRMITVAMGAGEELGEDEREWFDRAIAAQIDFMPAWYTLSGALLPRWGGSHEAMYALAKEAAATNRFDTEVPNFFVTELEVIARDEQHNNAVYTVPETWRTVRAVFDGYLQKGLTSAKPDWLKSRKAALAYQCGFPREVVKIADELGDRLQDEAFSPLGLIGRDVVEEYRARSGKVARSVEAALAFERGGNGKAAGRIYATLLAETPADDPAARFAAMRVAVLDIGESLRQGQPVIFPLAAADDLRPWSAVEGTWKIVEKGVIRAVPPVLQNAVLHHRAKMPESFSAEIEFKLRGHNPKFSLIFHDLDNGEQMGVVVKPDKVYVGTAKWVLKRGTDELLDLEAWHTLRVDADGDAAMVTVNGAEVIGRFSHEWLARGKPMLGLFAGSLGGGDAVELRNLKVTPK